jgi:flagellin
LLDRLSTLATQAASSASTVDHTVLDNEFQAVLAEIDREANVAGLNSTSGFSVFVSSDAGNGTVGGTIGAADTSTLAISGLDVTDTTNAAAAVTAVASAITTLGQTQATVGTLENSLQYAVSLAASQIVNDKAAESRIRDANIAEESANLTRYNILTQSGIAALAQANQTSAAVLALLR